MNKMIVIVRNDLSNSYKMVQGSHALSQFAIDHTETFEIWNNKTLIFLAVPNLISLRSLINFINNLNIRYSVFREPDLDDQETAICYKYPEDIIYVNFITDGLPLA